MMIIFLGRVCPYRNTLLTEWNLHVISSNFESYRWIKTGDNEVSSSKQIGKLKADKLLKRKARDWKIAPGNLWKYQIRWRKIWSRKKKVTKIWIKKKICLKEKVDIKYMIYCSNLMVGGIKNVQRFSPINFWFFNLPVTHKCLRCVTTFTALVYFYILTKNIKTLNLP